MDANDLVARLTRRALETPGIHVAPAGPSDAFDFAAYRLSAQPETAARVVRGGHARSTAAMFDEFAAAWQFPPYFGRNWPAFDECLGDLDWLPARAYVLVVLDAQKLLDHEPPEAFQALVDRLVELTHEGPGPVGGEPSAFHAVFQVEPPAAVAFRERLEAAAAAGTGAGAAFDVVSLPGGPGEDDAPGGPAVV